MRIGVVVDASCDLPHEFMREHRIEILPVTIRLGDEILVDTREPQATQRFYQELLASKGLSAETIALTAEQIRERFLDHIVVDYDYIFCITITSTRSPIFENASRASFAILNDYKSIREQAGVSGPFALRVVDSKNMFSATGVLAAEVATNDIRARLDELREKLCGYMVPGDLYYIRNRAIKKGDKSVGLFTYAIGTALDVKPVIQSYLGETKPVAKILGYDRAVERLFSHVSRQIERGLATQHLCISYGGDPEAISSLPGYAQLALTAREHGVEILNGFMSATAAVNTGGAGVAIAYCGELRDFEG
jgi:DegV family protein with EDD domain